MPQASTVRTSVRVVSGLPRGFLNERMGHPRVVLGACPPVSDPKPAGDGLERLGPYELVRRVGYGATSEVYEARRVGKFGVKSPVALKKLMPELCSDSRFLNMFVREAVVYSRLSHPNILQIQDFNEVDGQYFIVTDFVDGLDLDALITCSRKRGESIPPTVVSDIMAQLLRGLDHAHRTTDDKGRHINLLHRDIKPSNVLIAWDGTVKVGDFGVARTDASAYQSVDGQFIKGTLRYMSPEHVRLQTVVQASDLFSAGVVLYEMVTLQPFVPLDGSMHDIVHRIAHEPRGPLLDALPDPHRCFRNLLEIALQPDAIRRYGTAAEFLDDLNGLAGLLPPGPVLQAFLQPRREDYQRLLEDDTN